jgi:hypothetical protein
VYKGRNKKKTGEGVRFRKDVEDGGSKKKEMKRKV